MLAAKWRAAGFDSPSLRRLAQLYAGEVSDSLQAGHRTSGRSGWSGQPLRLGQPLPAEVQHVQRRHRADRDVMELMPEVLRSIGFDPAPADEEFTARCQKALDLVQHDLNTTGYGCYQMRARLSQGWPPTIYATLPDGSHWAAGEPGITRGAEGSWLLVGAALSVSATLKEIAEIEWPVCVIHGGHPSCIWDGEDPADLIGKAAWWRCTNTGHPLAPVGQLTAETARTL